MNKKILASIFVIGILALAMGYGTYSYFSDTAKSTGNVFTAGTLDLKLANAGGEYTDGVTATWSSPAGWAPGETVEATLYMKNDGSIGIHHIRVGVENLDGTGLWHAILLTKFEFFEGDITDTVKGFGPTEYPLDYNGDGKVTLHEFINWCAQPHSILLFAGAWATGPKYIPAGGTQWLKLGFTFDPAAGDDYQGLTASFDLKIVAYQVKEQTTPIWVSEGEGY